MSQLRDFYLSLGHNKDSLANSLWYLSELSLRSAVEIDNYKQNKNNNFSHINEFMEILNRYNLNNSDISITSFPYLALWRAISNNSQKKILTNSELALEMKLLNLELKNILSANNDELTGLCSFFSDLYREFSKERYKFNHCRLAV